MLAAHQSGDALLHDVAAAEASPELLHVWWLGQAGFLLAHAGRRLVFDPYLSDSLTAKYAGTATPHVRISERVVAPERLTGVDVVLGSHHHTDHLDPETLRPLLVASPDARLVVPEAHRALARERADVGDDRVIGLDDGAAVELAGLRVEGVPAAHETLERDDAGRLTHLGYVVSAGPFRVYHAGDTVPYDGQAERVGAADLALLPINGRVGVPGIAGNLDGAEAAALAAALPARVAVPGHFAMFAFNTADPGTFAQPCARLGVDARVLRPGERLTLRAAASGA